MKNLFANLVLFLVLSVAFSSFTACSTAVNTQKSVAEENVAAAPVNTPESETVDYPPVPQGIMQADITDLEGNVYKLESKKGKVVLVNLWATWCGPCRAEMPELIAMQEKYRDRDFEVIGLNADDESVEEINEFAQKMKLNYELGYAKNRLRSEFIKVTQLSGIPQSILINREGQLRGVFTGAGSRVINKMKETVDKAVNE